MVTGDSFSDGHALLYFCALIFRTSQFPLLLEYILHMQCVAYYILRQVIVLESVEIVVQLD